MRTERSHLRVGVGVMAAAALAACGQYDTVGTTGEGIQFMSPDTARVPLASAWAYVDAAAQTVFLVDGHGGVPRARAVPIGARAVRAEARVGQDELVVLTQGVVGARGVKEEPAALAVISAATASAINIPVAARYDGLAQSRDRRFIVLHFSGAAPLSGQVAFNPNQLGVIDFATPTPTVQTRSVPSLGSVPTGIDFAPPLTIAGEPVALVVVRSKNYITLLDLLHPERGEVGIPLTLSDDPRVLTPTQIVFDSTSPAIFLRATGSADIFAFRLAEIAAEERAAGAHNFRPVLSQLAAGREPTDMALYDAGEGVRLLVAGAERNVHVIDAASSRSVAVPVEHDVSRIVLWQPPDAAGKPQALLTSATASKATFVDLQKLETLKSRNLEVVAVPEAARQVHPFEGAGVVVLAHATFGLTVVDLNTRAVTPIGSSIGIQRMRFTPPLPLLWLITTTERLGSLSLVPGQLSVSDLRLDAPVEDILLSPNEPDNKPRLLVTHADPAGYVTVLDAAAPSRLTARSLRGFTAVNLIERTERNVR